VSFTATFDQSVIIDGKAMMRLTSSYTEDGLLSIDPVIADSTTDQLVDLAFVRADASMIFFQSDQDVTLEFNSNVGAGGSISLGADFPWIWHTDKEDLTLGDVITADVTAMYITNASGSTANIKIRVLLDAVP